MKKVTCFSQYRHSLYSIFKYTQTSVSAVVFMFVAVSGVTVRVTTDELE